MFRKQLSQKFIVKKKKHNCFFWKKCSFKKKFRTFFFFFKKMFRKNCFKKWLFQKIIVQKKIVKKRHSGSWELRLGKYLGAGTVHGALGTVEVVAFSSTMRPEKVSSQERRTSRLSWMLFGLPCENWRCGEQALRLEPMPPRLLPRPLPHKSLALSLTWKSLLCGEPGCAWAGDRSEKFRASGYGARTRTNCGVHQGGSTACSTAHSRTNCACASPYCAGAQDRAWKSGAQVVERIQEHIVESIDQEELDQLRNVWLMGELELENDEDGRRERKPSSMKIVNRTRLKHPDLQRCCRCGVEMDTPCATRSEKLWCGKKRCEVYVFWYVTIVLWVKFLRLGRDENPLCGEGRTQPFHVLVAAPRLLDSCALYHEKRILISTKASLNEMLAPGALVILSPWSQDFWLESWLVRLVVWRSCVKASNLPSLSNTGGAWDNAKKYISAGGLGPDHAKVSDTYRKTVTGDTVGDPLKGHFWICFEQCDEAHCDPQPRVWVSHCCASNPKGGAFWWSKWRRYLCFFFNQTMCGLRGLFVSLQCLAFLGLLLDESSRIRL